MGGAGLAHVSAGLALPKALGLFMADWFALMASDSRLDSWGYAGFWTTPLLGVNSLPHQRACEDAGVFAWTVLNRGAGELLAKFLARDWRAASRAASSVCGFRLWDLELGPCFW